MTSKAYNDAIKAHDSAIKVFHAVRDAFRARTATDDEFLAAQAVYIEATKVFDKAYEHEERYGAWAE